MVDTTIDWQFVATAVVSNPPATPGRRNSLGVRGKRKLAEMPEIVVTTGGLRAKVARGNKQRRV